MATGNITEGKWHHVAWVRHFGYQQLFVDGKWVGSDQGTIASNGNLDVTHLVLGQEQDSADGGYDSNQRFIVQMDEVMIFDRSLSQYGVAALAQLTPDEMSDVKEQMRQETQ